MYNQNQTNQTDTPPFSLLSALHGRPQATARLAGDAGHPALSGLVRLYQTAYGVIVYVEVRGLPYGRIPCADRIFGFHIHEGGSCTGTADDPFAETGMHYNPADCPHPYHAGDLPPLFGCGDMACQTVLTNRFTVEEVIGRTVILHDQPDDFTSQPSGNAGRKIACGRIQRT